MEKSQKISKPKDGKGQGQKPPLREIKQGIKKGKPERRPPKGKPPLKRGPGCEKCVIKAIQGVDFPKRGNAVTLSVPEDQKELVLTATPDPAGCPCKWSKVSIEYVIVIAANPRTIKRKTFKLAQLTDVVRIDPKDVKNPYVKLDGCKLTIAISQLNTDLRNGIRRGNVAAQGVVTRLEFRVSCNGSSRTISINVTDPAK